ncbi:hypothetical protein J8J27_30950, partial [Mycobacterium tuberculosis]|nr:hypothetical protein [Mycobacterium tuberculosis]
DGTVGRFAGSAALASEQPQLLAAWLRKDKAAGLVPAFVLSADVEIDGSRSRLANAELTLGGATATGSLVVDTPADGRSPSIAAEI